MSKIVENDRNLLKDALMEYNAIKEEAIKVAKDRLAKSMPDVIEKFLKEELENHNMKDEGIISTESSMTKPEGSSVMETMKGDVSESEDLEDDMEDEEEYDNDKLTAEAIKEALAELEDMDLGDDMKEEDEFEIDMEEEDEFEIDMEDDMKKEGMYEEDDQYLDEHDLNLELDFDENGLNISGNANGDEFDFEEEFDGEDMDDFEDESEGEFEDEMDDESEDDFDMEDEMESDEEDVDLDSLEDEEEVEALPKNEAKVRTFAHKRTQAGKLGSSKSDQKFLRPAVRQESVYKKDIDKLIKENNDLKSINLEFKDALKKYKTQLYEMAVFNANLSHVNNLFVEHTTTVDEKKQILNKFKSVATIEESKSVYNKFVSTLNESKKTKKTIEERVEKPSVGGDSGSQKLNESLNVQNEPDSVKAIKKMMKYIETKRK
jgi:hypothetical protein